MKRMYRGRTCDFCATERGKIVRFQLVRPEVIDGRKTSRAAGAIELCARCWQRCRAKTHRKSQPVPVRGVQVSADSPSVAA